MTIQSWLETSAKLLRSASIPSPELDTEIILAHTISHPRTWLHAHSDEALDPRHEEIASARIDLRLDYVPIAYIIGHREFYGRKFSVSPAVLIPRPESEMMITLLNECLADTVALAIGDLKRLVDIGTGSGCLGITTKLEHPELSVTLLDTSVAALRVAEKNAKAHAADLSVMKSDLLQSYPYTPDIVLANLPYVDPAWKVSAEISHEPKEALFAAKDGLHLIQKCFTQLQIRMTTGGIAIFEADPRQWESIHILAKQAGFKLDASSPFACRYTKL